MAQTAIPYLFMRGGTSRGPYFKRSDLPRDRSHLAEVLISLLGAGHPLSIDGIGGSNPVTNKVAMLSRSNDDWADIDYFFAQVSVEERLVNFKPTCGNILAGVAAAAIEMGLVQPEKGQTTLNIRSINTGARVTSTVQTQDGNVLYEGKTSIDGVPGTAASVSLNFMQVAGSATGRFLPTGQVINQIDGIETTCMDVAMPMVIARAESFGLTGYESSAELDANSDFFVRMEALRIRAGALMGLGAVEKSVIPKFGLLAPARYGGSASARYFMPWSTHPTMAVTGSQCMASCVLTPGSVADGLIGTSTLAPVTVCLEHPMGMMDVVVDFDIEDGVFKHKSAGLIRTCRKLAEGHVFVPSRILEPSR